MPVVKLATAFSPVGVIVTQVLESVFHLDLVVQCTASKEDIVHILLLLVLYTQTTVSKF